jgi:hypothetical protein
MAVLFIPIYLRLPELYVWARPEAAEDPIIQQKAAYLNVPFFTVRAIVYFAIWGALVYVLTHWSKQQDEEPPMLPGPRDRRFRVVSGPGLVLFVITVTFMSVDWVMSLDPHWFSTIFGVLFMGGQGLAGLAFAIVALAVTARHQPLSEVVDPSHFHDLGKLLLAFVMLWAYFAFSQFLIIWSGNLPEEIPWFIERLHGGWGVVAVVILAGHFIVPFLVLLSREVKRNRGTIALVAGALIVMRLIDLVWMIAPRPGHRGFPIHWMDVTLPVALGGIWIALFARELTKRRLLAVNDPYFEEVFAHGHH